ncbi:MAG: hypothetical protein A2018_00230 [Alphaproteobacteria bacterium GWF2_58_20]|nr:MAG: hypothetical protein A2018_00230 [Alphaproteobacteria bacterium GWF2_58_20]
MSDSWEEYRKGVKPLEKGAEKIRPPRRYVRTGAGARAAAERFEETSPPVCVARDAPPPAHMPMGRLSEMDRRNYDRFRKGKWPIDSRLDLHGLTQAEAWVALRQTVEQAQIAGLRCLLVITGRGRLGGGEWGVLRQAVPEWLKGSEISSRILAYHPAQRRDGGEGAYYVLLRRLRA